MKKLTNTEETILKILAKGCQNGDSLFEIVQTKNREASSMDFYPAISGLIIRKMISSTWKHQNEGHQKYFSITPVGRKEINEQHNKYSNTNNHEKNSQNQYWWHSF